MSAVLGGIDWDDIVFAASEEDVPPAVIALICTLDDWRSGRINRLHDLFDNQCTAQTEIEAEVADMRDLYERHAETQRQLAAALALCAQQQQQFQHVDARLIAIETKQNEIRALLSRLNLRHT